MPASRTAVGEIVPISTVSGKYACSSIGASTLPPDAGRSYPVKGEDFGTVGIH